MESFFGGDTKEMTFLTEIRWHGRGGQGVVTAGILLAQAALLEGKHVQAFPEFGPERMGAPIRAFTRISDEPINIHSAIYRPDTVVVIDPTLLGQVAVLDGLKDNGVLLVNSEKGFQTLKEELNAPKVKVYTIDATRIALDEMGRAFFNTPMLGSLIRILGTVSLDSLVTVTRERFPEGIGEKNVKAIERAYKEVKGG